MTRTAVLALGTALFACALYAVGPLWAGWQLRQAMKSRDRVALETHVDWAQLRANMKPRLVAAIRENADKSGTRSGMMKRMLGPAVSDAAVDALVTPANLSRILAGRALVAERFPGSAKPVPDDTDAEDPDDPVPPRRIRWAFFEGLTRFRVEATHPRLPNNRIVSILALQGLSWRLIDVDIGKR